MTRDRRLAGKRILLIEDDPVVKLGLENTLREAGAVIVRSFEQSADAAVLDVNLGHSITVMPIAKVLRERSVPFLFYTGQSESFLAPVRKNFPESRMVYKPAKGEQIIAEVCRLWETR